LAREYCDEQNNGLSEKLEKVNQKKTWLLLQYGGLTLQSINSDPVLAARYWIKHCDT
jgi:hypothetical protein